jgi:enoyl-CoA hydratase
MTEPSTITTEVRGHVFLIGLDRPHKLNAFNLAMLRELSLAFSRYEREPDLWCAVLFGHGDNFTAGLDLAEVGPAVAGGQPLFPENGVDPLDMVAPPGGARRRKPVVCAVQGWCLTIGMELLMAADIRVAAEGTRFSQLEVKRGIMPFGGATLRFPQIAGWGDAMRYLLTGDEFGAREARRMGLVQDVVEEGEQVERAIELAQRVARQAPLAVQATLASARMAVEQGAPAALEVLMDQARGLMGSEDAREGVRSFIERREAVFKGK